MDNEPHNEAPQRDSDQMGVKPPSGKPNGTQTKGRVRKRIISALFGAFLLAIAQFFIPPVHKFLCLSVSFFFLSWALKIELRNHTGTKKYAIGWASSAFLLANLIAAYAIFFDLPTGIVNAQSHPPTAERRPHLRLILNTSDSPATDLMFTNDFLFVDRTKLELPEKVGFLVVRVPEGRTNAVLKFSVINDSETQIETLNPPELTANVVELEMLMCPSDGNKNPLRWTADPNWKQKDSDDGSKSLFFAMRPLLPGRGDSAPPITFENNGEPSDRLLILATMRAQGVPRIILTFNLVLVPSKDVFSPRILAPQSFAVFRIKKSN